ncbi:DUF4179 domain-containing protein [Olsenella phocaeensis]|uniref:DUF4179 domain-containing protein n=1 Tax=Olsenella phocaeensis TaxID=1852385 RepID=UPI003A94B785
MNELFDDYAKGMGKYSLSEDQKDQMARRLADAVLARERDSASAVGTASDVTRPATRRHAWWRAAAAAAALTAALGLGGVAYATGTLTDVQGIFDDIFAGAPAATEVVNKVGHPLDATSSDGGITVTADAVIGDRSNYVVVLSLAKDDGTPFEGLSATKDGKLNLMFGTEDVMVDGVRGAYGSSYFYDRDPSDNSIQFVRQISLVDSQSLVGKTMRVSLGDLRLLDDSGSVSTLADGSWKLKFKMDYEDSSIDLPAGQGIEVGGIKGQLKSASLSSIALKLGYELDEAANVPEGPSGRMGDQMSARMDQLLDLGTVTLNMRDGTTVEVTDNGGGSFDDNSATSTTVEKSLFLPQAIDPTQVESVSLAGATIPVA